MQQDILYIKLGKNVEVTTDDIFLKDLGSVYCQNDSIVNHCKSLKICKLKGVRTRKVISVIKVIEMVSKVYPNIQIENIGETDIVVEHVKKEKDGILRKAPKILFVAFICFFGTAFTIMAFHNDIQIQNLFNNIHEMIRGTPSNGHSILEFSYSLGLGIGIIVFFNHIGGRRITKEPTPVEVSMKLYEDEVNQTIIDNAERMNIEVDVEK